MTYREAAISLAGRIGRLRTAGVSPRKSLASCDGAFRAVVSRHQSLGSDNRTTLCQALPTCLTSGAAWYLSP